MIQDIFAMMRSISGRNEAILQQISPEDILDILYGTWQASGSDQQPNEVGINYCCFRLISHPQSLEFSVLFSHFAARQYRKMRKQRRKYQALHPTQQTSCGVTSVNSSLLPHLHFRYTNIVAKCVFYGGRQLSEFKSTRKHKFWKILASMCSWTVTTDMACPTTCPSWIPLHWCVKSQNIWTVWMEGCRSTYPVVIRFCIKLYSVLYKAVDSSLQVPTQASQPAQVNHVANNAHRAQEQVARHTPAQMPPASQVLQNQMVPDRRRQMPPNVQAPRSVAFLSALRRNWNFPCPHVGIMNSFILHSPRNTFSGASILKKSNS